MAGSNVSPVFITYAVHVLQDPTWSVYVSGKKVVAGTCTALQSFPLILNSTEVSNLLQVLDKLHICAGHAYPRFVEMVSSKKGKINSKNGKTAAYLDDNPIELNGSSYLQTFDLLSASSLATQ